MQRNRGRRLRCAGKQGVWDGGEEGQATLEYLLVLFAITAMLVALCALARAGESGVLANLATRHASHAVGGEGFAGGLLDALMY